MLREMTLFNATRSRFLLALSIPLLGAMSCSSVTSTTTNCQEYALLSTTPVEGDPVALATGDFDGDGDDEAIVARAASGKVSLLAIDAGRAKQVAEWEGIPGARAVEVGDFDGDGKRDFAVAAKSDDRLHLFFN